MTNGINTDGFSQTKPVGSSPWGTESYTEAPASAFPATDMSTQGNAGFQREGSAAENEAGDYSESL